MDSESGSESREGHMGDRVSCLSYKQLLPLQKK